MTTQNKDQAQAAPAHTPWKSHREGYIVNIVDARGEEVAAIFGDSLEERERRGELIAAAPETRAACEALADALRIIQTEMDACRRDHPRNPMAHLGARFDWALVTAALAQWEEANMSERD